MPFIHVHLTCCAIMCSTLNGQAHATVHSVILSLFGHIIKILISMCSRHCHLFMFHSLSLQWLWLWIPNQNSVQLHVARRRSGLFWDPPIIFSHYIRCEVPHEKLQKPQGDFRYPHLRSCTAFSTDNGLCVAGLQCYRWLGQKDATLREISFEMHNWLLKLWNRENGHSWVNDFLVQLSLIKIRFRSPLMTKCCLVDRAACRKWLNS